MTETWKPLPMPPDRYEVSDMGRIRNIKKRVPLMGKCIRWGRHHDR